MKLYLSFVFLLLAIVWSFSNALPLEGLYSKLNRHLMKSKLSKRKQPEALPSPPPCPVAPSPVPLPNPLPDDFQDALNEMDELFQQSMTEYGVVGMSAAIVYDQDIIWSKGYGQNSKSGGGTPDLDSVYRIGSLTKVLTDLVLLRVRDSGKLSLDDTVQQFWPSFQVQSPYKDSSLTFRELATQLSGLFGGSPCSYLTHCKLTTDEAFKLLSQEEVILPTDWEPHYSDVAYAIIGRAIEAPELANTTWEDYLTKHILSPLGMNSTGNDYTSEIIARMPSPYLNGTAIPLFIATADMGWARPTGNAYSTVNDLSKLVSMYFRDTDYSDVSPLAGSSVRESMLPYYVMDDAETAFGFPFEIYYSDPGVMWYNTKGGLFPGYTAFMAMAPKIKLGVVVCVNDVFAEVFGQIAINMLIPALKETLVPLQPPPANPGNLTSFVGDYKAKFAFVISIPATVNMTEDGNQLTISFGGFGSAPSVLDWIGGNTFQIDPANATLPCTYQVIGDYFEHIVFSTDSNGNIQSFSLPGTDPYYGLEWFKE